MKPIRQKILETLQEALSGIRQDNGFKTDIGTRIVLAEGKRDLEALPALWLTPGKEECESTVYGEDSLTLSVTLRAGVRCVPEPDAAMQEATLAQTAENLLADLRMGLALFSGLSEDADDILYISGGVEDWPDWAGGETALTLSVEAQIRYSTARNNPYG